MAGAIVCAGGVTADSMECIGCRLSVRMTAVEYLLPDAPTCDLAYHALDIRMGNRYARGIDMATETKRMFDLHCDTLDRLCGAAEGKPFNEADGEIDPALLSDLESNVADISLERMEGARWCQCFGVFMPDELRGPAATGFFDRIYGFFLRQMERHDRHIVQVRDAAGIDRAFAEDKHAALLTVEGGSVLAGDLGRIELLVERGVRIMSMTWNGPNELASGNATMRGLTRTGRMAIPALEEAGIIIDVSHLNDTGFWELAHLVQRPIVATHSNSRAVCDHPRNLTDDQFAFIVECGGLVGINFCKEFLVHGISDPKPDHLLQHVDHLLNRDGEDVLALGSDYDGADLPSWLAPCDKMLDLHDLLAHEFGDEIARKICFGNAYAFLERECGEA